jgi:hypothetical protein
MSSPSASQVCVVCGHALPAAGQVCPECRASAEWQDLIGAARFAQARFKQWERDGLIGQEEAAWIAQADKEWRRGLNLSAREGRPLPAEVQLVPADRCWSCNARLGGSPSHCPGCGAPAAGDLVQQLRYWSYACAAVKQHQDVRRLSLAQAHTCINDAKGRIAALRANLEKQRQPVLATAVDEGAAGKAGQFAAALAGLVGTEPAPPAPGDGTSLPPPAGTSAVGPRRARMRRPPLWEILLDPRSIQWLLGLGGTLLVLGLVIWLATLGLFKNPLAVAVALGLGNAALLGGGWAITSYSRYQTAGRALTLLACLVMPLNLWFYHSHGLITLEGHLWIAALVCCVLYAASAMVLRDPMFVYVLAGGVAMTGLLMLADMGKFWEIAAPSTLLVTLGLICLHVERAFPEADGPFARCRFGLAFFWSGQALLAAGLLLLLGAQLAGDWLYKPFFEVIYQRWQLGPPLVVTERWGQLLALALVLAGTYAYAYSDLVVRRVGAYIYLAVFTLLWAEVLVINLLALSVTAEVAIIALALTALLSNLIAPAATRWQQNLPPGVAADSLALSIRPLARASQPLGLLLSTLPVLLGLLLYLRATYQPLNAAWPLPGGEGALYHLGWLYVGAMLLTAVACRIGAHLYRHSTAWLSATYFFGTAAATLVGLAGLLSILGIQTWHDLAAVLMAVPILYAIAARLYRGHSQERPLLWAAQAATAVILVAVLAASAHLTPQHVFEPEAGTRLNLSLALVFAEAAVFYALAAAFRKHGLNVYLCTAAASGAVWQLLQYWHVGPEYYTLTFAVLGLVLLVGYRLALWERTGLAEPAFQCANALMSLGFVAAGLLTLSRLATSLGTVHWSLVLLLAGLAVLSLLAAWLVRHAVWRRWYVVMAIAETALMFLTVHLLSHLSVWQKMEIFSVAIGIGLLAIGHVGWYREQERQEDLVSFSLLVGGLLLGAPLAIAVLIHRTQPEFSPLDELGMLTAGIVLLATGFMFQLRSTTLTGAALLMIYLVTLVLYINMLENVQTAAIWMTIGGGTIFAAGLLLSIYRDRLLTLPDQVKRREGVFRVLGWR